MLDKTYVYLGLLGKTFALKGECYFYPLSGLETKVSAKQELVIELPDLVCRKLQVESIHLRSNGVIIKFDHIDSPEDVRPYVMGKVYARRADFPLLPVGEYYLCDLIGFDVHDFLTMDQVGRVVGFEFNSAHQTIMIIALPQGDQLEILVHPFMKSVDLERRRCYIMQPDYE